MNVNTQEIYSEVYSILNLLGNNYIDKLPKSLFKMIEEEKSSTYNPKYSEDKDLNEQNIKRESISMIALFHLNYWCNSNEEKEQLKQFFKSNEEKHQRKSEEKYKPDNLFESRKLEIVEETKIITKDVTMVEYKESIFKKIINKIKSVFYFKK